MGQEQSRSTKPLSPTGAVVTLAVGAGVAAAVALYSYLSEDGSEQTVTNQGVSSDSLNEDDEVNSTRIAPRDLYSKTNDFALVVFNLPRDIDEPELRHKFERIGCKVYSAKKILDHEGNFSGTFSIKMEDEVSVQLALRLNGKTFKNKTVHIVRTSDLQLPPPNNNNSSSSQLQLDESTQLTETPNDNDCKVCFERSTDAVFIPCGHVVACFSCASQISMCPICRTDVDRVVRLYFS